MKHMGSPFSILLAEDHEDEYELARVAFANGWPECRLTRFIHGEALLDYLLARGSHAARVIDRSRSYLILLDLNMPVMGGHDTLMALKAAPELRTIPVVVFTNTGIQGEIDAAYELGANAFIRKPVKLEEFVKVVKALKLLWCDIAKLPSLPNLPAGGASPEAQAPSGQTLSSSSSSKPK